MTTVDFLSTPSATPAAARSWSTVLLASVQRGIAHIQARRRMRHDTRLLLDLDDRMLADLGLHRAGVEHAVRYGRPADHAERRRDR